MFSYTIFKVMNYQNSFASNCKNHKSIFESGLSEALIAEKINEQASGGKRMHGEFPFASVPCALQR